MRRDAVVAAVAIIALLVVAALGHHDEAPKAATHASTDFSFGGYRGWYGLLAREGVHVERFREHHDALAASGAGTLIVAFPADGLPSEWNAAERDAVRAWVRGGGRMVDVGLTPSVDRHDADGERVFLTVARRASGTLRGPWAPVVGALAERGASRLVPAKHARVETLLRDDAGALVVRYRSGRGEVVGVADAALFENREIGRSGDARLAYLVARGSGAPVAFDEAIRGDIAVKAWYRALNAPELLGLSLAAFAGLSWLAYGIVPLGPAVRLRAAREPAGDEFVDAVAALYERARVRDHARDVLARAAHRTLARAPQTAETAALARRIAEAEAGSTGSDAGLVAFAQVARDVRENEPGMTTGRRSGARATRRGARRLR